VGKGFLKKLILSVSLLFRGAGQTGKVAEVVGDAKKCKLVFGCRNLTNFPAMP
jgi:hypothetical protein